MLAVFGHESKMVGPVHSGCPPPIFVTGLLPEFTFPRCRFSPGRERRGPRVQDAAAGRVPADKVHTEFWPVRNLASLFRLGE